MSEVAQGSFVFVVFFFGCMYFYFIFHLSKERSLKKQ